MIRWRVLAPLVALYGGRAVFLGMGIKYYEWFVFAPRLCKYDDRYLFRIIAVARHGAGIGRGSTVRRCPLVVGAARGGGGRCRGRSGSPQRRLLHAEAAHGTARRRRLATAGGEDAARRRGDARDGSRARSVRAR